MDVEFQHLQLDGFASRSCVTDNVDAWSDEARGWVLQPPLILTYAGRIDLLSDEELGDTTPHYKGHTTWQAHRSRVSRLESGIFNACKGQLQCPSPIKRGFKTMTG